MSERSLRTYGSLCSGLLQNLAPSNNTASSTDFYETPVTMKP